MVFSQPLLAVLQILKIVIVFLFLYSTGISLVVCNWCLLSFQSAILSSDRGWTVGPATFGVWGLFSAFVILGICVLFLEHQNILWDKEQPSSSEVDLTISNVQVCSGNPITHTIALSDKPWKYPYFWQFFSVTCWFRIQILISQARVSFRLLLHLGSLLLGA